MANIIESEFQSSSFTWKNADWGFRSFKPVIKTMLILKVLQRTLQFITECIPRNWSSSKIQFSHAHMGACRFHTIQLIACPEQGFSYLGLIFLERKCEFTMKESILFKEHNIMFVGFTLCGCNQASRGPQGKREQLKNYCGPKLFPSFLLCLTHTHTPSLGEDHILQEVPVKPSSPLPRLRLQLH